MRQFIRKIGLTKSILLFSFLAVCLALVSTLVITTDHRALGDPAQLTGRPGDLGHHHPDHHPFDELLHGPPVLKS